MRSIFVIRVLPDGDVRQPVLVSLTAVVSGRESSPARNASPFAVGVRDVPWPSPSPHVLQLLVCCSRCAGTQGPVPPDASTKCVSSGRQVKPYLTLLFPSTQGWTKRCLPSAGLPSLLLLPLAITAEGPQGHEMSAIGQVRPSPRVSDGDTGGGCVCAAAVGKRGEHINKARVLLEKLSEPTATQARPYREHCTREGLLGHGVPASRPLGTSRVSQNRRMTIIQEFLLTTQGVVLNIKVDGTVSS